MISANPRFTPHASRFLFWATAVLLLAALFRLAALQDVPPGLAQDEVLDADIAMFIREGRHALFFREGYGHEPLYHYWAAPFALLLGDNVLAVRLPSVFLGLLLVALTLRWAKREFGGVTAVTAGLLLAVSWWPIIFSRIGIRPILEPALLLLMAWFWPKRPFLAGLFLGLSLYSYTGARVMLALPVLLGVYEGVVFLWGMVQHKARREDKERWRTSLWAAGKMLTTAVLVAAPLFYVLQADPTLQQRVEQLSGPLDALRQGDVGPIWHSTVNTLGVFSFTGDPRWTYTLPDRPLFDWVTAVFFYAGLGLALWRVKQPRHAFLLLWLTVALIPSAITPQSPSTIRLIGALPVVYVLPGLAVTSFQRVVNRKNSHFSAHGLRLTAYGLLFTVLLLNAGRTVRDGFIRWPQAAETRLEHYQTVLLDMSHYLKSHPTDALVVADGFYEPIDRDTLRRNLGYDPAARWMQTGAQVAGAVVLPAREMGENGRLLVPEFAPINPVLLAAAGIQAEPLYRSDGWPSFAVYELPPAANVSLWAKPISFEGMITLEGYEVLAIEPGELMLLATSWRVEEPLPPDLSLFVHLLDAQGHLIAQYDGFDAAARELQPGDIVVQLHTLALPKGTGPFVLEAGLYTRGDNQRLRHDGMPNDLVVLAGNLLVDGK